MTDLKLILFPSIFLFLFACTNEYSISHETAHNPDKLDLKQRASDEYLSQRMDSNGEFHFSTYEKSLIETRRHLEDSRRSLTGNWEVQGPGNIGARINSVAVHPENELIIFAGFANGGLWKSQSGGIQWKPVFDDQNFLSISDVIFNPKNPEVMYAGTGDANITGYSFLGDGIYKSHDGGESWRNIGLQKQRVISEIIVNPVDTNIVYAATMGLYFERDENRGLYKSFDAGATWTQVLFVSDSTGIIDIAMDPSDPDVIFAAAWDRIRNNKESIVSGETCGIYKTTNGGMTWDLLTSGLPREYNGRIGLDVNLMNPDVVHAVYTDSENFFKGIYKSIDSGETWQIIPNSSNELEGVFGGFGWYFGKIRTNPNDPNDLFVLGVDMYRKSGANGKWLRSTPPWWENAVHADKHDLLIDPTSGNMYLATDGGLYKGSLYNDQWYDIENIPTTQFYEVGFNPHDSDKYYGGAQDNGTTSGNKETINDWARILGGDGFRCAFHPTNRFKFYASSQRGNISYTNDGGLSFEQGSGFDFNENTNWNTPYIISPHDPSVLYAGRQSMYQSTNQNTLLWEKISPELTDHSESNLLPKNISSLNESPVLEGLLYAGTADGNIIRRDSINGDWLYINEGLPQFYVYAIEPSHDFEENVFVSLSGYRTTLESPMIFYSKNKGEAWESISGDLPPISLNDIYVMPNYRDSVLFAATDAGVYYTKNLGKNWARLGENMPLIPVFDLELNPANNQIIAGTFARSIMTFDLEQIDVFSDFEPPVSVGNIERNFQKEIKIFPNPSSSIINLEFSITEKDKNAELVILDASGKLVEQMTSSKAKNQNIQLDVSNFANGAYFVKAKFRHTILNGSFLKVD